MTRLYLPSSGTAPISPTPAFGWASLGMDRLLAVLDKTDTAMTSKSYGSASVASGTDYLVRQYVFPLQAGVMFTTSDTVKGQVRAMEAQAGANLRGQFVARVIGGDGSTVQATLVDFDLNSSPEWDTTLVNRTLSPSMPRTLAANYTAVANDYLVLEVGFRAHATTANGLGTMRFGDTGATDLPEDQTTTDDYVPWVEFSTILSPPAASRAWIME